MVFTNIQNTLTLNVTTNAIDIIERESIGFVASRLSVVLEKERGSRGEDWIHLILVNIFVGAKHFGNKSLVLTNKLSAEMLRPSQIPDAPRGFLR